MKYTQKNIETLFQYIGEMPNQIFRQGKHFDYIKTTDSVWPNQLINFRTPDTGFDEVLDQLEKQCEMGLIPNLLMLDPNQKHPIERLKQREYKGAQWMAMTHDLNLPGSPNSKTAFHFKSLKKPEELGPWLAIVESELMGDQHLNEEIFNRLLSHKDCHFFLGYLENQPAATALLFLDETSAGIYLVSTTKKYRKQGLGKAITLQCLKLAQALGCTRVEIQATELGKGVYASLGFKDQGIIHVFRIK